MASVKLHIYIGQNDGTESCDFRGDKFIGKDQGDEHRTIAEIDPAAEELIEEVLELGPALNRLLSKLRGSVALEFGATIVPSLRIGVWDE